MEAYEAEKSVMERVRALLVENPANVEDSVDAIYELYDEYKPFYLTEWERLDDNEKMYHGEHWVKAPYNSQKKDDPNDPKPTMPVIASTIENIKAGMADELPEAIIHPDWSGMQISARVLQRIVNQELLAGQWEKQWMLADHDFLVGGWVPFEVGFDPDANNGYGGAYIRYQINKNMLFDPECADLQDGRAIFKIARKPKDWFLQRFPDKYPYMVDDNDLPASHDGYGESTVTTSNVGSFRLIEAWVRTYDPEYNVYRIHFVQLAGHQLLFNSAEKHPDGYYAHGRYPFEIACLFPRKGCSLGYGIVDLFKDAQRYRDKLDQIVLKNALMASSNRMLYTEDSGLDGDDLADFSKQIIKGDNITDSAVRWFSTAPLPAYLLNYIRLIQQDIKQEAGSNDQSRGQSGNGVTAAGAIQALQEMSTKRDRYGTRILHFAFVNCVNMMLSILREFNVMKRKVPVTINGHEFVFLYDRKEIIPEKVDGQELTNKQYESLVKMGEDEYGTFEEPIDYYVDVKSARQTDYQKLQHNELWKEMMVMLKDSADPVIMLEGFEFDEKEQMLDNIRRAQAGGVLKLQKQVAQLMEIVQKQQEQIQAFEQAKSAATAIVADGAQRQKAQSAKAQQPKQAQQMA